MNNLDNLKMQIEKKLAAAEDKKRARHRDHNQSLMEMNQKQEHFRKIAGPVMPQIIVPRLEQLVHYFDNAEFVEETGRSRAHSKLHFRHTKRFPASTKLELSIGCDMCVENVIVSWNMEVLPVIVQFERHQEITLPLDKLDEEQLAAWLDERLCHFVDSYLQLEQADEYYAEHLVTDPVCGMRVVKTFAAAQMEYQGRTHYFCVESCRKQFAENPSRYLSESQG